MASSSTVLIQSSSGHSTPSSPVCPLPVKGPKLAGSLGPASAWFLSHEPPAGGQTGVGERPETRPSQRVKGGVRLRVGAAGEPAGPSDPPRCSRGRGVGGRLRSLVFVFTTLEGFRQ